MTCRSALFIWVIIFGQIQNAEAKEANRWQNRSIITYPGQNQNVENGLVDQPRYQNQHSNSGKLGGNENGTDNNNSKSEPECIESPNPNYLYNYWYRTMNPSDTESEPESDGS
jgi:hypothetical protein